VLSSLPPATSDKRIRISRTYYKVTTPTMFLEIYRDDIAGDWYLQRVID
jgi:hypothetical protein